MSANDDRRSAPLEWIKRESLVVGAVWAVTSLAAERFYSALGTSPAVAGFDFRQSLLSTTMLVLAFAPSFWLAVITADAIAPKFKPGQRWSEAIDLALALVALPALFAVAVALIDAFVGPKRFGYVMPVVGACLIVVARVQPELVHPRRLSTARASKALVPAAVISASVIWGVLWNRAADDARSMTPTHLGGLSTAFLAPQARVVCLQQIHEDRTDALHITNRPVVLLGLTDSHLVVRVDGVTRVLPAGDLAVVSSTAKANCGS